MASMITIGIMMTMISNITFTLRQFIAIDLGGLTIRQTVYQGILVLNFMFLTFKDFSFKHLPVSA